MELNKYYNIDCLDYMKTVPDKFFDLAIVDPPYRETNDPTSAMRKKPGNMKKWQGKPKSEYFTELFRISKNQIIWGMNNFDLPPTSCFVFWHKKNPMRMYADGELAWTSFKQSAKYLDYEYRANINAEKNKIHVTQKPVYIYRWLLKKFSKPGNTIFDSHVGSASSLIACIEEKYKYVGCEIDKDCYDLSTNRIQEHINQGKLF